MQDQSQSDWQVRWGWRARHIMRNEPDSLATPPRARRKPVGVEILGVLMVIAGILFAITGVAFFVLGFKSGAANTPTGGLAAAWVGASAAAGVIFLAFGGLHAFLAIGLLKLRNAARVLTIFLFSLSAVGACLGLIATSVRFNQMALAWNASLVVADAMALWYLLRPQTKKAFGA